MNKDEQFMHSNLLLATAIALSLSACAVSVNNGRAQPAPKPVAASSQNTANSADLAAERVVINKDPFPSAYQRYPGAVTLLKNATLLDGKGGQIDGGDVLLSEGKILAVGKNLSAPKEAHVIDATGKWVTPGIIDSHSHLGVFPSPSYPAHSDGNEATAPITANVWAEHGVWPQDPGFGRALAGGVTALHILPGSANLIGGRGTTLKNVPGRTVQEMKFPGAPYSLKMACGENPKRVYGSQRRTPATRMANIALVRQEWARAQEYKRSWEQYEARLAKGERADPPRRDINLDTLVEVLRGNILIQNHCYRADEMALMIDMGKEFGYKIAAFHHAVESYKIADVLAREGICSMMWADWWGFKLESFDGIRENIPFVHAAGACAVVHSDDDLGIQRLNQEAAKALSDGNRVGLGISKATAWTWLSYNPAKALGIEKMTGSLEPGKMADVVLWNRDPFSVYARAQKVWVDGALMFDLDDPKRRVVSDFELGHPGAGDPK
jgi:imidazolonepropionase-like amidohydrolase